MTDFPDIADWDREARQFAEAYARRVVANYRREADRKLAVAAGALITPVMAIGAAFAIGSGEWWFAALAVLGVVIGLACLYQGIPNQENHDS
ncbi:MULTISPECIES: hypothetical protein [Mycolicibacterium]|jgi:hypothetical protein|uniref:Uncharacterized protein n=3 Tax=Mycolicibacterium TaxID=1866885 RepID=A0AAE4VH38_MYCFO|nr:MULTISPECIES: hypothetical protein [Mycolicibacterium]KLI04525.1 hypothetical protein AA982_29505 [Mycolicibacterium senegalense]KLO53831.1 hypothetical protein ABW05_22425 [Mycolicibacterium senegalense]KMV16357.1 hypothetical protein ACT17_20540 [Mycolicibacterium conceptionense]MDV7194310.1 hypothetical protein [Mycolicibacterium fortuitum]MDV7294271.1 hypothetical protein [Mycolicibacterium fortuitum]